MRFSIYQDSKIGGRTVNQDRMGYTFTKEALLLVVCDGMGGHFGGELAAQLALQVIHERFVAEAKPMLSNPAVFLDEAIYAAHDAILDFAMSRRMPESPRTTVVACVIQQAKAFWAHVGDSRLYMYRRGILLSKTRDHSKLELMQAQGLAIGADNNNHPDRNTLYNCLGSPYQPLVEQSSPVLLTPKDCLLLCSDGLWANIPETSIGLVLTRCNAMEGVPKLIQYALAEGGPKCDNVTGLGINWLGESPAETGQTLETGEQSTFNMAQGGYESTLHIDSAAAQSDVRIEEEIDAAVNAINEAIRKTDPR